MELLISGLNEQQKEAVAHRNGPLVIFAGAGSGKTRVITTRIAQLIQEGVLPTEILAVTFTNKAAQEMKQRVEALSPAGKRCFITTFHSACARWLREFAEELGFTPQFTIYDDSDATAALKKILKGINAQVDIPKVLPEIKSFLNHVKTMGWFPNDVERLGPDATGTIPPAGLAIYRAYQEFLAGCNAMDFGDLLMNVLLLLRRNEKVRRILQHRYRYIMVDEYQDTNQTQFELIQILAEKHGNLVVVGDDDQSIYSWRGANPTNILQFTDTFAGSRQVALEQNYRCKGNIVKAASAVIANNVQRAQKTLFTQNEDGELIDLVLEADGYLEAWWIVEQIKAERFSHEDIAIFYRTNSQSRILEEALRRENIPYRIYGGLEFYARMEIKDIIAYLKLVVNPSDEMSLRRILNVPARGLGNKAVELIEQQARARGLSMMETLRQMGGENVPRISGKLRFFADLMGALKASLPQLPLKQVVPELLEATEYLDYLQKKFPDQYREKVENVYELAYAMEDYALKNPGHGLAEWLEIITLVRNEEGEEATNGVTLMTLHMAKGLEFPRVYIAGVEEGLLPHRNNMDGYLLEEERRLFYVGMTRAKEKLSLLCAERRQIFGNYMVASPSRFLKEIPRHLLHSILDTQLGADSGYRDALVHADEGDNEYVYDDMDDSPLTPGMDVMHPTFGRGTVEGMEMEFGKPKCVVFFPEFGSRKIRVSQLTRVSRKIARDLF